MKKLKSSSSLKSRITAVKAMDLVLTAVFYGRSGSGKTTVAATFPKPMLVIDIGEKGTDSISDVRGVDVIRIRKWSEIEEIYWMVKNKDVDYKSVVIDAVHSMQDMAIDEAKRQNTKDLDEQTSKRDFGVAAGLMKTWIFNFRDLEEEGVHVVFIVHDRVRKEEEGQDDNAIAPEVGPSLMPSVASPICGAVKVVGHTFIRELIHKSKKLGVKPTREIQYCMRLGPHSYYTTKIRSPKSQVVPYFISDPSFEKIVEVMKGLSEKGSTTPVKKLRRIH